ncbi:hypothetical protein BH23GEM7_BH23GEM7_12110 [soil metagenome]|nr:hypothetical protein [Gemmatimonadota bacterium]
MRLSAVVPLLLDAAAAEPAGLWMQYADPAEAGFSPSQLTAAHVLEDSLGSGAVMVVHRCRVVAAWRDVARRLQLHSVRKSLVSALYGPAVAEGRIWS